LKREKKNQGKKTFFLFNEEKQRYSNMFCCYVFFPLFFYFFPIDMRIGIC